MEWSFGKELSFFAKIGCGYLRL